LTIAKELKEKISLLDENFLSLLEKKLQFLSVEIDSLLKKRENLLSIKNEDEKKVRKKKIITLVANSFMFLLFDTLLFRFMIYSIVFPK
jgi:hypothetical protein